jgi:protein ImuB
VDRLACVDLPAFPLQLLCRRHPDWRGLPVVVVSEDKPQGVITWVNEKARAARILPGQRYAHALSLSADLRAGVVSDEDIAQGVAEMCERLRGFSPAIEPYADQPGVFWMDASGLERLYGSLRRWARAVFGDLREQGYLASLVLGFSRFGTYAVARARPHGVTGFDDEPGERAAARDVPLELLGVSPRLRDALQRLGITTVGGFVRLPAGGLLKRFGKTAHQLHALAAGERWDPLRPKPPPDPAVERLCFDDPERDSDRLLFAIKRAVDALLGKLAGRQHALSVLILDFTLDRADPPRQRELIRPAEPTLDARTLLRLVHLRLENRPPRAGVNEIELSVEEVPATREQLTLFAQKPRRDLRAGNEALAQLRAEFGNHAVMRARVREGHLPEARFSWEPLDQLALPEPRPHGPHGPHGQGRSLVRRVNHRPFMLPPQEHRYRDDGWLLGSLEQGPVVNVIGPFVISGGWWMSEVHREYHFAETRRGDCLWVYYDRRRRRWFLQGQVE